MKPYLKTLINSHQIFSNVPQFLLKDTKNIILKIALEGVLYSQAVMIQCYFLKTKVTKENLVKDEDQNNEIEMNNQNGDINGTNSTSAKDKDKTRPSEATEETKREKYVQKNHNQRINFKDCLKDHNIDLIEILTKLKTTL